MGRRRAALQRARVEIELGSDKALSMVVEEEGEKQ
jgi:hypothetical protein